MSVKDVDLEGNPAENNIAGTPAVVKDGQVNSIKESSKIPSTEAPISPPIPSPAVDSFANAVDQEASVEKATSIEPVSEKPIEEEVHDVINEIDETDETEKPQESNIPEDTAEGSEDITMRDISETDQQTEVTDGIKEEHNETQEAKVPSIPEAEASDASQVKTEEQLSSEIPNSKEEDRSSAEKHDLDISQESDESSKRVKLDTKTEEKSLDPEALSETVDTPIAPEPNVDSAAPLDPPEGAPREPMPKHQQKVALSAVRAVKRLKDAGPFVQPVDPVKLNIPTYPDVVKNPMDLATLEKKTLAGEYTSYSEFLADIDLIVSNCILFNGTESPISTMARNMKASFDKYLAHMPPYEASLAPVPKPKKKSLPPPVSTTPKSKRVAAVAAAAAVSPSGAVHTVDAASVKTPTTEQPFALQPSGIPTIRRDSTTDGRPKREIHPPKPKDLPYGDIKPRKKKFAAELRFCGIVLKDLMSKKNEAFSFPFLQPVDPVALNCPTYFKIVKHPMDLSTVQNKYNNNEYETADDFEADVKLMFKNCYKFNPEGSPVNMMGHRLEAVFDKKWLEKPIPAPTPPPPPAEPSSEEESEYDSDDENVEITNHAIKYLEKQLEKMQSELAKMKKEAIREARDTKRKSKKKKSLGGSSKSGDRRKSTGPGRKVSTSVAPAPVHVTYDMKKELSEKINTLNEKKLQYVVTMIQDSMPDLKNSGQDEIELDMDQLDPGTLLKIYNYVVKKDDGRSSKPRTSIPSGGKASTKSSKKKSRPLTEDEQNRQIEQIQKKIRQFDRVKEGEQPESSDEESSDGGNASSDSSSEEE